MSDHLPQDLVTKILVRLPVTALLRCRCVSKAWRALIDSPRFSKLQIEHSATTGKNAILFISELHGDYVVDEYVNGLHRGTSSTPRAQTSGTDPRSGFALIGSCNGLLCFACDSEKVLISNPATKHGCFMPFTLSGKQPGTGVYRFTASGNNLIYNSGFGFGYDSMSDDYKVVEILQVFKPEENSLQSVLVSYGVWSNSWVEVNFPYILLGLRKTGVFVGGAVHWIAGRHEDPDSDDTLSELVIIGFDLELNELREVPQPEYTVWEPFNMVIGELGKCLCLFANYKDKFVDVWMMKEYGVKESWSLLFKVPHPGLCYNDEIKPLGFSVTGQEVLLQMDGKKLVWYDLKDPKKVAAAEKITVRGLKGKSVDAVVCYGSLVSPYGKVPPVVEEVKVDKQQEKPGSRTKKKKNQREERDDFLSAGFKLNL
ncbi:unnamed protein product [Linum tenue]|uniref:F-box domain-containing protein n=1 Tax=Linum tenue TaxID=586396 RepID=A0AAV0LPU0_9ROSI|nr:unnamed protein product [Linum tenue]